MTPHELHQTAAFLRERFSPPDPAMRSGTYVSHEAMHALADALDQTAVGVAETQVAAATPGAPSALHEAIDRAWSQVSDGHGHPLHRDQADEDDLVEVLQQLTSADLTRVVESLQIVRAVAFNTKAER